MVLQFQVSEVSWLKYMYLITLLFLSEWKAQFSMFVLHHLTIFSVNICSVIYNIFSCSLDGFIMNTIISIVFLFVQPLIGFFVLLPSLLLLLLFFFSIQSPIFRFSVLSYLPHFVCIWFFSIPLLYLWFLSFAYAISICSGSSNTSVAGKVSFVWYNLHLVSFQWYFLYIIF